METRKLLTLQRRSLIKDKRGILVGTIIFIVLNIVFFSMLFYFVYDSVSGIRVKEKMLAKEVAMFINSAEPGTFIELNIQDYKKLADKNKIEDFIRVKDGSVWVALAAGRTGFSYPYFSDYTIESKAEGDFLTIEVEK